MTPHRSPAAPHLVLTGPTEEIGRQHGRAIGPRLRGFLDDRTARLGHLLPEPLGDLGPVLDAYATAIQVQVPELAAEMDGLARGGGMTWQEVTLLQARRELIGYSRIPSRGDCTTYALAGTARSPVLAQTIDLNGDLEDQIAVLDVHRTTAGRRTLVVSFGGQLGYLGLNDAGLAVGINMVLSGSWCPGLPVYLAVRHLLDHASSIDEAIDLLVGLRLASSRCLTLCDPDGTATVELAGPPTHRVAVRHAPFAGHTNHFLDPWLATGDQLNVFARNSSIRRLEAVLERAGALGPGATAEDHLALLAKPPINVTGTGDIAFERTVAAVVLLPARGELHLRAGDPAEVSTTVYSIASARVGPT